MSYAIEVSNLFKKFPKRKTKKDLIAVNDVSFQIPHGKVVGLLGPNGAGKSTIIKLICGILEPDQGSIYINEIDIQKRKRDALNHFTAVLEGNRNVYWRLTVQENLEYFAGNRGYNRKEISDYMDELLIQFKLEDKRHEVVHSLSRGMQQKLAIATALVANTDIILLDEPTLGLDIEMNYEIREILHFIAKEKGKTIIISSHDMRVIQETCHSIIIINKGKVVANEKVKDLIRLFETRAYYIKLGEHLNSNQINSLTKAFPLSTYNTSNYEASIDVNLQKSDDIYILMDILRSNNTLIENVEHKTIDFEQVFLHIIREGDIDV